MATSCSAWEATWNRNRMTHRIRFDCMKWIVEGERMIVSTLEIETQRRKKQRRRCGESHLSQASAAGKSRQVQGRSRANKRCLGEKKSMSQYFCGRRMVAHRTIYIVSTHRNIRRRHQTRSLLLHVDGPSRLCSWRRFISRLLTRHHCDEKRRSKGLPCPFGAES